MVVADAAAWLGNVLHARLSGALNIVAEGEERVGADRHARLRGDPRLLFLHAQNLGLYLEDGLPDAVSQNVLVLIREIDVDGIVTVGTAGIVQKLQAQYLGMLAQIPVVRLLAGKTCAVDTALLARAHADSLAVFDVADGVGLGVFERDERDDHVDLCLLGKLVILGDDVRKQRLVDLKIVPALLEGDAEHIFVFLRCGNVFRIDLNDVIAALFLCSEDLKRFIGIARGDDAVGDLFLEIQGGRLVADVAERSPVAVGAQPVGAACTDIGTGDCAQPRVLRYKVDFSVHIAQRQANGRTGRGDVLERSRRRQAGSSFQLSHELPRVQRI